MCCNCNWIILHSFENKNNKIIIKKRFRRKQGKNIETQVVNKIKLKRVNIISKQIDNNLLKRYSNNLKKKIEKTT